MPEKEPTLGQKSWFANWYDNRTQTIRNEEIDDGTYQATIKTRFLAQPTPLEIRKHTHYLDIHKKQMQGAFAQAISAIADAHTWRNGKRDVRLDIIVTDGAQVQQSRPDHYCLWVKEVYA